MQACLPDPLGLMLGQLPEILSRVHRWTHFPSLPAEERESVLEHSYVSVLLAGAMLAIEEAHGSSAHGIDRPRVLLAAALHDVGEGRIGDIRYAVKQDPRVRDHLDTIEREQVASMLRDLPEDVRRTFWDAYRVVGSDTIEGRFFQAVERIGYMQFAVPQVQRGRTEFLEVFRMQHDRILALASEFVSVRTLYEPYRAYVEEQLHLERRAEETRIATGARLE